MVITEQRRSRAHRRSAGFVAAMVHRVSGLLLALFLPMHFLALGLAIEGEARLQGFLAWTEQPAVQLAEAGLVFLLAVHLIGGLRLLALEAHGLSPVLARLALPAVALAALLAGLYVLRLL